MLEGRRKGRIHVDKVMEKQARIVTFPGEADELVKLRWGEKAIVLSTWTKSSCQSWSKLSRLAEAVPLVKAWRPG